MNRRSLLVSLAAAGATIVGALIEKSAQADDLSVPARAGQLGVAAIDLHNGRVIQHDGNGRYPLASTFKLPLVMDVLARVDRGTERLDRVVRFSADDLHAYSPVVGKQPHGGTLTVGELCAAAVEQSDNTAANLLLRRVGGPEGVTAYLRGLGDTTTRLDRYEPALNEARVGDPRDTTTPIAMATVLQRLVRDPILSPASKNTLFGWLRATTTGTARIRAGVPSTWTVGDKTGTTNSGGNDVAILSPPHGSPIVIAVYFADVKPSDTARDATIAATARAVVRRFRD